jgi:hypothetical protein
VLGLLSLGGHVLHLTRSFLATIWSFLATIEKLLNDSVLFLVVITGDRTGWK